MIRVRLTRYRLRDQQAPGYEADGSLAGPVVIIDQQERAQLTGENGKPVMVDLPPRSPVKARWWGVHHGDGSWEFMASDKFHADWESCQ